MRYFGYARVSTSKQCLDLQFDTLEKAGVNKERIFFDKKTGSNTDREGLKLLKIKVERGDVIFVTKLDRLGRNTLEMIQLVEEFNEMGVAVRFLGEGISTEGSMATLVITILAAVGQSVRSRILENTNEGRAEAKSKGVKFGRKRFIDRDKFKELYESGIGATKTAKQMNISRATFYKLEKELKAS